MTLQYYHGIGFWLWFQTIGLLYGSLFTSNIQAANKFIYQPPNLGTEIHRIGGAVRHSNIIAKYKSSTTNTNPFFITKILHKSIKVQVLAPRHVALTSNNQPRLYWYLQPKHCYLQVFQIKLAQSSEPLLKLQLPILSNGGIQFIDLAKYGIILQPNKIYHWQIALVEKLKPVSQYKTLQPIISQGKIQFVANNSIFNNAKPDERPYLAASQGFWYDALDGVSRLVNQDDRKSYWHTQRAMLLEQVQLEDAAAYDRKMATK
ncbi:hypothetical protein TI05_01085 [Achromatium sp. WMS3]|nr:hypothetical protein TI05_01085 [Achromatium sp. WMS3]